MVCLYQILVVLLVRRVGARDDAAWMINVTRYGMDAGVSGFSKIKKIIKKITTSSSEGIMILN